MERKTIAENMRDIMLEQSLNVVWYGDIELIHECAKRSQMQGNQHPLHINNRVLSALDKSHLFIKGYIKHMGRPARSFKLRIDEQ